MANIGVVAIARDRFIVNIPMTGIHPLNGRVSMVYGVSLGLNTLEMDWQRVGKCAMV